MPELERRLARLGGELAWPAEPDLAPRVAARLRARAGARRRVRPLSLGLAVLAAAAAVAFAVPPARSAILDFLGVGAVRVERVETLPDLPAGRVAGGERVTLARARAAVAFPLAVPPEPPPAVFLDERVPGGMVTFAWEDRLLSQLQGDGDLVKKVAAQGTRVEQLRVAGGDGLWIAGAPHGLWLPGGPGRLAGNVLVWTDGSVTFRLEGDLTRAEALAFAGTLRAPGT